MKNFKQIYLWALLLFFVSCENKESLPKENVNDLGKMSVESIWAEKSNVGDGYVIRIKMKNLTSSSINPPRFANYEGIDFVDDGSSLDKKAKDLIYTSKREVSIFSPTSPLPDEALFFIYNKSLRAAKTSGWGFEGGIDCDQFCLVGHGQKCCGQTCDKSVLGGTAWFCIGGCGCKSTFKLTYK